MNIIKSLFNLFYPNTCVCCDAYLASKETLICVACRHDLPFFDNQDYTENELTHIFTGRVPIEKAGAFLQFQKQGKTKNLIHQLKYKGVQEIGAYVGRWWGNQLTVQNHFKDVDYIIPVPLHKKKEQKRGYNQLTTFGKSLSLQLNSTYLEDVLIRKTYTKTQTYKNRFDRFVNIKTKFELVNIKVLENKHVLLIDDVITTGATIEACSKELLKSKNLRLSVLSMAFTV